MIAEADRLVTRWLPFFEGDMLRALSWTIWSETGNGRPSDDPVIILLRVRLMEAVRQWDAEPVPYQLVQDVTS